MSRLFQLCAGLPGRPCTELTREARCPSCTAELQRIRPSPTERYGPGYQRRHREVYGQPCALRLPGCTGTATTADHAQPVSRGGMGSDLRPACRHCNSSRGNRPA